MTSNRDLEKLSPWWKHGVLLVLVFGFTILIWRSVRTYSDAPPIPLRAVASNGDDVFSREDIVAGQNVFLKFGLMDNGTIWGHGRLSGTGLLSRLSAQFVRGDDSSRDFA